MLKSTNTRVTLLAVLLALFALAGTTLMAQSTLDGAIGGTVTDQSPEAGAKVPAGSPVRVWLERGGGSAGVREPRRPKPAPRAAREMRDEPSDRAAG